MGAMSLIAGTVGIMLLACGPCLAENQDLPPGPGRELVYGQCRTCHDLQYLKESAGIPRDSWDDLLDSMKQYGLRIPPDQRARILDYLGTYLGPNPPPAGAAPAAAAAKVDGASVFADQCSACHQQNGEGVPGQFPPLARNPDVFLAPDFPLRVVLFGLKGRINVNGQPFDGEMPPFDVLSDAQVAAVVAYVRGSFGNAALRPETMPNADATAVANLRRQKDTSSEQVFIYRKKLKAGAENN